MSNVSRQESTKVVADRPRREIRPKIVVIAHEGKIVDAFFRTRHESSLRQERVVANALWEKDFITPAELDAIRRKFPSLEQARIDRERNKLTAHFHAFHRFGINPAAQDLIRVFKRAARETYPSADDRRLERFKYFMLGRGSVPEEALQMSRILTIETWRGPVVIKVLVVTK